MGRSHGAPTKVPQHVLELGRRINSEMSERQLQRDSEAWQLMMQAMMAQQTDHDAYMQILRMNAMNVAPRPRDIYIAGQVIDGLTGELKHA